MNLHGCDCNDRVFLSEVRWHRLSYQCGLAGAQELKARDIDGLDAKIADLTATIDKLAKEIAALQAEVAEMQKQLKRAGEDREVSEDRTVELCNCSNAMPQGKGMCQTFDLG